MSCTVPTTSLYDIVASGAQGGHSVDGGSCDAGLTSGDLILVAGEDTGNGLVTTSLVAAAIPVPEPAGMALLGVGALGTPAVTPRRRRGTGRRWTAPARARKGGAAVGPNPTDRGRPGTQRHIATDARGTPPGIAPSGVNRHDSMMLAATLDVVPGVRARHRGRPRRRRDKLHADKGCDRRRCRRECRVRGIRSRIARRGIGSGQRLGQRRWMVGRTSAWLNRFRRPSIRYKQRVDPHLVPTTLVRIIICLRQVRRLHPLPRC